jgi:putative DNA primase/helicase
MQTGSEREIAETALSDLEGDKEPIVADLETLWLYAGTHWRKIEKAEFRRVALDLEGELYEGKATAGNPSGLQRLKVSDRVANAAYQIALSLRARPGFFDNARPGVSCKNGFVTLDCIEPHDPSQRTRHTLPFDYDATTPAWLWERSLAQWLAPLGDEAEQVEKALAEFVGACLLGIATSHQRAVLLLGDGGNGKSQFITAISRLFDGPALGEVAPHLLELPWNRALLDGVLLNRVTELPETKALDAHALKALISGDPIIAARKGKDPFRLRPRAGHLFAANEAPPISDHTVGFWRRWIVVPFKATFRAGEEDHVVNLADALEAELPGIAAWAVTGARRLVGQRDYTQSSVCDFATSEWRDDADQVRAFLKECTEPAEKRDQWLTSGAVYALYQAWADMSGVRGKLGKVRLGKRLKTTGVSKEHRRGGEFYELQKRHAQMCE